MRALIGKIARTGTSILLRGETGVGKEVVAREIHGASARADKPFVKVNCAALSHELLESELFGHERGAFTHAHRRRLGWFEHARTGTLFLDEIGELPLDLQAKLLHVLQDGEFHRVGGHETIKTDVHLITATNRDLEAALRAGEFRPDLYYRLNVVEIRIPPLRERVEEIRPLAEHFLRQYNAEYGRDAGIPEDVLALFDRYAWPGNVRELENLVRRAVVLGSAESVRAELRARLLGGVATPAGRRGEPSTATPSSLPAAEVAGLKEIARRAAREAERAAIAAVLERVHWNRAKAARMLRISYKALGYKLVEVGLVEGAARTNGHRADGAGAERPPGAGPPHARDTASPR